MSTGVLEQLSTENSKRGRLQRIALRLLLEHERLSELPTSVRFLFYEAEQAGHVSKVRTGARRPDQDFGEAVTYLRDHGIVPWDWLVDESRRVFSWESASSIAECAADAARHGRIDPWLDAEFRPIILTEARTTAGVFARTLGSQYLVDVAASNGQAGGFLVTEVVPLLDVDTCVLYVGDFDLSGDQIEANTRRVLEHHAGFEIEWERVAITEMQAEAKRREGVDPIRKTDRRYKPARLHEAYEAETLGQGTLSREVVRALDELLPEPLREIHEREAGQRAATMAKLGAES